MELEKGNPEFVPMVDRRMRIEEPLPVRLVAVADATLPAAAGLERDLEGFYVGIFGFQRDAARVGIVFRAENFDLIIDVIETNPQRESMRPIGIEVNSLGQVERTLIEREIEYLRQKGTTLAHNSILLTDPAGNWVEIFERREI